MKKNNKARKEPETVTGEPQCGPDEVFVGFLSPDLFEISLWHKKRIETSQSIPGKGDLEAPVYPVFVDKTEYIAKFGLSLKLA